MERTKVLRVTALALGALLVVALIWAISGQVARTRYRLKLSSMYERSFYAFLGGMDELEVNLSKLMVSAVPEQDVLLLSNVSRLAGETQRELAALNQGDENVSEVMEFVTRLQDYSNVLVEETAKGGTLSQSDRENLGYMLARQEELGELAKTLDAQALIDTDAHAAEKGAEGDAFAAAVEPETQIPALIYDGPFSQGARGEPKGLGSEALTREMAPQVATAFLGTGRVQQASVTGETMGEIPCWLVEAETSDAGRIHLMLTKQGGRVLMASPESSPPEANYTVEQCRQSAEGFLRERDFGIAEASYWQMYQGLIVFNFVPVQDSVRLYPDLVKVQVSMKTAQVVGFEAGNYLRNHVDREIEMPAISKEEAVSKTQGITVEETRLCLIPTAASEKFCYELKGTRGEDTYLVYVNALDGRVENILKLLREEDKEMGV